MGNLIFSESAWEEYLYWQSQDKKTLNVSIYCLKISCETVFRDWEKLNPSVEIYLDCRADVSTIKTD